MFYHCVNKVCRTPNFKLYYSEVLSSEQEPISENPAFVNPFDSRRFHTSLNPLGFPSIHIDEAHYMRRAMLVLEGSGPQESANSGYPRTYDHPYFGQLFLAGLLGAVGYPNSLHPTPDVQSIEMLHLVPRVIMGILSCGRYLFDIQNI